MPIISYAYDADDADPPLSKAAVLVKQYAKTRVLNANQMWSVFYKPRVDKTVYQSGVTSAYTTERACWLDCSNDSINHYGMKIWINNWFSDGDTASAKLTITPTYYLALRDTQ